MSLNWTATQGIFLETLYSTLAKLETKNSTERLQGAMVNGNFTLGVGFDMVKGGAIVQNIVLSQMGLKPELLSAKRPEAGTPAQLEYDFLKEIIATIQSHQGAEKLNSIMARRATAIANDAKYLVYAPTPRNTFSFFDEGEVRSVFEQLWNSHYKAQVFSPP